MTALPLHEGGAAVGAADAGDFEEGKFLDVVGGDGFGRGSGLLEFGVFEGVAEGGREAAGEGFVDAVGVAHGEVFEGEGVAGHGAGGVEILAAGDVGDDFLAGVE
jgi:hypothetical protein